MICVMKTCTMVRDEEGVLCIFMLPRSAFLAYPFCLMKVEFFSGSLGLGSPQLFAN